MSQQQQQPPYDPFKGAVTAGQWGLGINQSLALIWMIPTNKWGTFGRRYFFVNVVIALLIVYPSTPLLVPFETTGQAQLYGMAWWGSPASTDSRPWSRGAGGIATTLATAG